MYRYQFTSTIDDLLEAEEADMTTSTVRRWMRWVVAIIGLFIIIHGLLYCGSRGHCWRALPPVIGGSLLLYYIFVRSCVRRRRIRKENAPSLELTLEFRDDCLQIDASGLGTFRREWSELLDFRNATRGILLYFDDGIVNWLPNRVFEDRTGKEAFVDFLRSHEGQ